MAPGPWASRFGISRIFSFHFHPSDVTMWAGGDPVFGVPGVPFSLLSGGKAMRMRYFVARSDALSSGWSPSSRPSRGGFGFGGGGPARRLVNNKAVQEDLKMTEDQVAKVKEWSKEFRTKSMEICRTRESTLQGLQVAFSTGRVAWQEDPRRRTSPSHAEGHTSRTWRHPQEGPDQALEANRTAAAGRQRVQRMPMSPTLKLTDSQKTSVKGIIGDYQKERREISDRGGQGARRGRARAASAASV